MKKLRLDLDQVKVDSFATATAGTQLGTVRGQQTTACAQLTEGCSYDQGCSKLGNCSWADECSREVCSELCTGYEGCSEGFNCSQFEGCTGLRVCYWTP